MLLTLGRDCGEQVRGIVAFGYTASGGTIQFQDYAVKKQRKNIESVSFAGSIGPKLKLIKSIPLEVTRDEGMVSVWSTDLMDWGAGESLCAAMDDFGKSIRGLWEILHTHPLGNNLKLIRRTMHTFIEPR